MNLEQNTILITGGSSGLGLEMARKLSTHNEVLICGRSVQKLDNVTRELPNIETFQCDLSIEKECIKLVEWVKKAHPLCNILINNAALVHPVHFVTEKDMISKARLELNTNFMAPLILSRLLTPILSRNKNPAIINITTGLVYAPRSIYPVYNSTKSALHSFTQVLRMQLADQDISVIEVLFPVVNTPWHNGKAPDIAISPEAAVKEMLRKLKKDVTEIRIGKVKLLYVLSRIAPQFALKFINGL